MKSFRSDSLTDLFKLSNHSMALIVVKSSSNSLILSSSVYEIRWSMVTPHLLEDEKFYLLRTQSSASAILLMLT